METVWDPLGHEEEIEAAKGVLGSFIAELGQGQIPTATLESVATAAEKLCDFGGCPTEAFKFVEYLGSPHCTSYQNVSSWLQDFLPEMTELIAWRLQESERRIRVEGKTALTAGGSDDDVPF